ncbi:phospholipase domain-containing protein [Achromobacter insuavis]
MLRHRQRRGLRRAAQHRRQGLHLHGRAAGVPPGRGADAGRGGRRQGHPQLGLAASGQWYDFAVTCSSDPAFYRRFAGRVETGAHTVSDPAMGVAGA